MNIFCWGKLSFFEKKKKEGYKKHYQDLFQKYKLYIKDNTKFSNFGEIKVLLKKKIMKSFLIKKKD